MREEKRQSGFSFAEAFVMASIFGLMLLVALPNYLQRRTQNQANDLAEAFRTYGATIQAYRNENGNWPEKAPLVGGHSTMEDPLGAFAQRSFAGGRLEWHPQGPYARPCLCLIDCEAGQRVLEKVDHILDDGDLSKGNVFMSGNRLVMVMR